MGTKHCPKCKLDVPLQGFYKDRNKPDGLDFYCQKCRRLSRFIHYYSNQEKSQARSRQYGERHRERTRIKQRRYNKENPEKRRLYTALNPEKIKASKLRCKLRKYGLTLDQYNNLITCQSNACAICFTSFEGVSPCIDHCHSSLKVRGLLCDRCNRCLGLFRDDPMILDRAAAFLRKHEQPTVSSRSGRPFNQSSA
jgi:hypothetical protein